MFHKLTARLEGKPIDATPPSNDRGGFWRSLDEIRDAEVFRDYITERFPRFAAHLNVDRREFLKLIFKPSFKKLISPARSALFELFTCLMVPLKSM